MPLNNSQYAALMRTYSIHQQNNARALAGRREEAYGRIPQLKALDDETASLGAGAARARIENPDFDLEEFRARLAEISRTRALLLKEAGYPSDYLEMQYNCPDCKDTGFIGNERCHCFNRAAIDLLYNQSGLGGKLRPESFDAFRLDYYPEDVIHPSTGLSARATMERIKRRCERFVEEFDSSHDNLLFYGETGLGKTLLSRCIAGSLIESSHSVIYYSAFDLFEKLARDTFDRGNERDNSYDYIIDCDLLIIDDLGTELTNAFITSRLFMILNERLMSGRSTIISTNLSLASIAAIYSERIASRITSSFILLGFMGNDIRIRKKLEAPAGTKRRN